MKKNLKKTIRKTISLLFIVAALVSCDKSDEKEIGLEKGYVTGKIKDYKGNPIAGAAIYLDNQPFYDSYLTGSSDENGNYKIKVFQGGWAAYASFKKEYNGQTYSLQLYPDNTDPISEDGGVCNFTWKLKGIDPDEDYYYGALITVHTATDFYDDYGDIKLTFVPKGPLIDGSQGETISMKYGDPSWEDYGYITDFPVGRYIVTAVLETASGNKPLKIKNWHKQDGQFVSEFQLDFIPDNSEFRPRTEAAIIVGY